MKGFGPLWVAVATARDGESVSEDLEPFLRRVYGEVVRSPVELSELRSSLLELLRYLSEEGQTNANCWAADLFFCWEEDLWEIDWSERDLPEEFHNVLAMMGEALHDTVRNPEVAGNFGCLPEQLLERVNRLQVCDERDLSVEEQKDQPQILRLTTPKLKSVWGPVRSG